MVLCAVHLEASVGSWISWSQAEIVEAPAFVRPVRSKVTYKKNPLKRPAIYLGLSPVGGGKGRQGRGRSGASHGPVPRRPGGQGLRPI